MGSEFLTCSHSRYAGSVPKSGCSSVFLTKFFLILRWRLILARSGEKTIFNYVSIQQDFISFLSAEIAQQKKQTLLSVLNVGQHCM